MRKTLDDFLAAADAAFGDVELQCRDIDPAETVRRAVSQDDRLAAVTTVRETDLPRISLDPAQFGRVVTNLARAELARGSSRITVDMAAGGERLVVVVVGDGPGPPPAAVGDVTPAVAAHSRMGLEERLAAALVGTMGGRLAVVPIPGNGSGYRIVLPRRDR
jgi:NtrC-family two-component system sensor histidine kinase KinB